MSKIKNNGLEQYGAEFFEQQTTGVEGVKSSLIIIEIINEISKIETIIEIIVEL